MGRLRLQIAALVAGLGMFVVCLADPPPLDPIVIGGDKPEPRGISSCKRDFGPDELGVWITQTVRSLCKKGDADSLLGVFMFTAQEVGLYAGLDLATLDRAYAVGKSNPAVLWTVVLTSKCNMPFQVSECDRMLNAARSLTRADPDNAMAWLALAYAADENLYWLEIGPALDRSIAAPRFHDYGFDVMKRAVIASGQRPIPVSVLGQKTTEQFRLQFASPGGSAVVDWLRGDCNARGAITPDDAPKQCAKAKELLQRGDSADTLSGNPEALAQMKATEAAAHTDNGAAYAKASIEAAVKSGNEREWRNNVERLLQTP